MVKYEVLRFCLKEWCETQYLDTTASGGSVVPATDERCMWGNDGMTNDREKWKCLKNYITRCLFLSSILHGKIIPGLNPKPRVEKSATPYAVSLSTAILQCDILYNNDIYININEGGGSGSSPHL
jgi:hypothetical protein